MNDDLEVSKLVKDVAVLARDVSALNKIVFGNGESINIRITRIEERINNIERGSGKFSDIFFKIIEVAILGLLGAVVSMLLKGDIQ